MTAKPTTELQCAELMLDLASMLARIGIVAGQAERAQHLGTLEWLHGRVARIARDMDERRQKVEQFRQEHRP